MSQTMEHVRAENPGVAATPEQVKSSTFEGRELPLVVEPLEPDLDLAAWASGARDFLARALARHGAVLFRGFPVAEAAALEEIARATSGDPLPYRERSSPRSQVSSGNVYTSTDHPPEQSIFLHNEQSYNLTFPLKIYFQCVTPAAERGGTPLADVRRVYRRLDPAVRERCERAGYQYVRNFWGGMGVSWQTAFQTSDRAAVEAYCRDNEIAAEWGKGDRLRTRQVRRTVATHPTTGERCWFNHMTFFHVSTLPRELREVLLAGFGAADLPNNTYYGDGSPLEPEVMEHLREVYREETVVFPWRAGDVLMVDNMMVAHGREPFSGPRKVVVAMAEPTRWSDV